jgi:hypothetical protein
VGKRQSRTGEFIPELSIQYAARMGEIYQSHILNLY